MLIFLPREAPHTGAQRKTLRSRARRIENMPENCLSSPFENNTSSTVNNALLGLKEELRHLLGEVLNTDGLVGRIGHFQLSACFAEPEVASAMVVFVVGLVGNRIGCFDLDGFIVGRGR